MHQFFQQMNFPGQPAEADNYTPDMRHNLAVMEIYNNWPFVRWLMYRYRNGLLKQLDPMENDWFAFVTQTNTDTESDKDGSEFIKKNLRQLNS